jgi:uncharacterized protein with GYD domain
MPHYLCQVSYTPEGWAALLRKPVNRVEAVRPAVEKLGGTIEGAWFAFGESDLILILDMPDNISAASFAIAAAGGGAVKSYKTTPLLGIEDGIEALKRGAKSGYKPATSK